MIISLGSGLTLGYFCSVTLLVMTLRILCHCVPAFSCKAGCYHAYLTGYEGVEEYSTCSRAWHKADAQQMLAIIIYVQMMWKIGQLPDYVG